MRYAGSLLLLVMLSGCSTLSSFMGGGSGGGLMSPTSLGPDKVACVGQVPSLQRGLVEDKNDQLLAEADEITGAGGVCSGKVFKVVEPIRVYRVLDAARGTTEYGRWWSLNQPAGSRELYREANAICPEWSELDQMISCQVKPGTQIVIGTTQSARCEKTAYPKSGTLQVFIQNNEWEEELFMENCVDEGAWPPAK